MRGKAKLIFLFALILFQFWFGIKPGWESPHSDFPNYYTSSRMIIDNVSLASAYDDGWFQEKITSYGFRERGKFSPFPPPTALTMLPVAWLEPMQAKQVVTTINMLLLILIAFLFRKISGFNFIDCMLVILLTGIGLANNFLLGQFYLCLLLLVTFGYMMYLKKQDMITGLLWGTGMAVKYVPFVFIPVMIIEKRWKSLAAMIVMFILLNVIAMLYFGTEVYKGFADKVLIRHVNGDLSSQSSFAFAFQSWNSFLRNCFVFDPVENPDPLIRSGFLFELSRILVYSGYIFTAVITMVRVRMHTSLLIAFSLLFLLAVLPASATYHYILLSLPFLLIIHWLKTYCKSYSLQLLTGMYAGIGFVPFMINEFFEGYQFPLILAFHRLWLITLFYIASVIVIHSAIKRTMKGAAV